MSILAPAAAHATLDLDRTFALESVGYLRAWDNVDGLFADYVAEAYKDYFAKQSRFVLQDLSKSDGAFKRSKLSYTKVIGDLEILGQLARSSKSQSLLRTKVRKEGPHYEFTIEWLHSPKMDSMATESFTLQEPREGKSLSAHDIRDAVEAALDRLIAKVPFVANVTGRDNESITINVGSIGRVKKGDTLIVGTIDEVKKHPLLHEIVSWRTTQVGRAEVEEVDEKIAFGKVLEEEPGRKIGRYQKILQIIPKPLAPPAPIQEKSQQNDEPPQIGWVSGGLGIGSYSRQFSSLTSTGFTGGGLYIGPRAEAQVWLNREWLTELGMSYGFWSYSQQDLVTGVPSQASSVSGSVTTFRLALGYAFLMSDMYGPKGWVKVGFQSTSYSLPVSLTELTAPVGFKAFTLGVGGDLPIRGGWAATLDLNFGVLTSGSETSGVLGSVASASHVTFFAGALYRYTSRMTFRAGLGIEGNGAEFAAGKSLSQKTVTIAPAVLYYF